MDLPVQPDDVLAQPSRARLFAALSELKRPASTEELAALLDLHPSGVRQHLERPSEAGLLTRERARHGRGRPRDMWAGCRIELSGDLADEAIAAAADDPQAR